MSFNALIGNHSQKELLTNMIQVGKISHSYLFIGPSGVGKTLFAKEFAKMLLCLNQDKPCQTCKSCLEFENENHPDFYLLSAETSIKIEQVRQMQSKILEKPIISNRKVYVIKDADTMTKEAQNCLLKTLEEPPNYVTIILIGANESMFLTTIKSRCTKIAFQGIPDEELLAFLKTQQGFETILPSMVPLYGGSIEVANRIQHKKDLYEEVAKVFSNIESFTILDVLNKLDCMYKNKEDIYDILDYINVILLQKSIHNPRYLTYIEAVEQTKKNLKANSNYDMSIDHLLYRIWEEAY